MPGGSTWTASCTRRTPCGWPSSASTPTSRTATSRISRRSTTPGPSWGVKIECRFFDSEKVEKDGISQELACCNAILIPGGGFGSRGIEGKVMTARLAREKGIPYLGVCLGFQIATIEIARDILDMKGAHTTELDPGTPYPVVDLLPEQRGVKDMGGSMRLGSQKVRVKAGSKAAELYGSTDIAERHRHRYEVNPEFIERLEERRLGVHRAVRGRHQDGDRGAQGAPVLRGLPVPSGVQVPGPRSRPPCTSA